MRETWHEHYIRLQLPEELRKICSVSFSIQCYLNMIQNHLQTIYGNRADWKKNIQKYYQSDSFLAQCREVKSLDDIPELSHDDVRAWIAEEDQFSASIQRLLELLPVLDDSKHCEEAIHETSILLGLSEPSPNAIYQWLIDWDDITDSELQHIRGNIATHCAEFVIVIRTFIKLCFNGRLMTYPVLETVMTQQKQRFFYRGENAYYGSSKPSAFRWAKKSEPEWLVHRVNHLRRNEGCEFLDNFIATFAWPYSSTNHYALCQHYGLRTEMLDITSDVWAALFFACTCFDRDKWRPLRHDEIACANSRLNIYNFGGDSRFAILYKRLAEPVELEWLYKSDNDFWDTIFPIGYQPYMRCSYQHAYMYKDKKFGKYKIRLTEDFCNWVFEQTRNGQSIFPVDDIPDISSYMRKINETRRFSWDSFMAIAEGQGIPKSEWKRIQFEMLQNGYVIDKGKVSFITEEELYLINSTYPPERTKMLSTALPVSDPLIIITSDEQSQKDREADDWKYRFMIVSEACGK